MDAFPPGITPEDGETNTTLICPNCGGGVVVRAEGSNGRLVFRCRVGHRYSAEDVLVGKEEHLETVLWMAVYACEELAAFLDDLDHRIQQITDDARLPRIALLREHAQTIRAIVSSDRPVKFDA